MPIVDACRSSDDILVTRQLNTPDATITYVATLRGVKLCALELHAGIDGRDVLAIVLGMLHVKRDAIRDLSNRRLRLID
jgi:hypothetical protein